MDEERVERSEETETPGLKTLQGDSGLEQEKSGDIEKDTGLNQSDVAKESDVESKEKFSEKKTEDRGKFLHSFLNYQKKENSTNEEDEASMINKLRQAEKNMGMKFSESSFENATFIINNTSPDSPVQGEDRKNLLGAASRKELLEWCAVHYQDLYFSMLLSVCILDRQPYQAIAQMSKELHKVILNVSKNEDEEKNSWNFKSEISEVLGIVEYRDYTEVRGVQVEAEFLRLQVHEQAEQCIQIMVNEFLELKEILTRYLIDKVAAVYGSRHNYMLISGCIEALAFISETDIHYFDKEVMARLRNKRSAGMDFCLSMLLEKLYHKGSCRQFVITCVEQWARLTNQPHLSLTALYVCSMFGGQEMLVCDIWMNILDSMMSELITEDTENAADEMSYFDMLKELFESGNRSVSYYKGVVHAFYKQVSLAEKKLARERKEYLCVIFLLLLFDDYVGCSVSGRLGVRRRDMVLIGIFKKLDQKTGMELTRLWSLALYNRIYPGEGFKMLEAYLSEYENYGEQEVENLAFFFYHINLGMGRGQVLTFLKNCALRRKRPVKIAGQIYRRIKE